MATKKKPLISIVGRPNVGKSTLVNRLAGRRICIVGEKAGITRDRNYIDVEWGDIPFTLIDTGGLDFSLRESIEDQNKHANKDVKQNKYGFSNEILEQTNLGISEADAIIFVVDSTSGVTKNDFEIAQFLRKEATVPVYVAANKVDSPEREKLIYDFYELGFEKLYPISAMHGSQGLSELLSNMMEELGAQEAEEELGERPIRISFVGKPNVGKSSLFNKLLGQDRSIVSEISGTTRDTINTKLKRHGAEFELVDTAGLRRKSKVSEEVERFSNLRAVKAIESCDVAIMIVDGTEEDIITEQDQRIANLIEERGKACVILVNKWDVLGAIKDEPKDLKKFKGELNYKLRFIDYAPKEFISAKTGQRTDKVWELAIAANAEHKKRISTSVLNQVLADITTFHPPPIVKQKSIKIKYATQVGIGPPQFLLFTNYPSLVPDNYKKFLEKQFREYFGFDGTPIRFTFKTQGDD